MTGTIRDTDEGIESEQAAHDGRGVVSRVRRGALRVGVFVCVLVLAGSLFAGVAVADDPVEIGNWTELQDIEENLDGHYVLVADLNEGTEDYEDIVGEGNGFEPIGDDGTPFGGTLDGDRYVIEGLYIDRSTASEGTDGADAALFSHTDSSAMIMNIVLVDATITAGAGGDGADGEISGGSGQPGEPGGAGGTAAALVATNDGTVTNSSLESSSITGGAGGAGGVGEGADSADGGAGGEAGGLLATNGGTLTESYVSNSSITGGVGGAGGDGAGRPGGDGGSGGGSGGLIATNGGTLTESYVSNSSVTGGMGGAGGGGESGRSGGDGGSGGGSGGLIATNDGTASESYVDNASITGGSGGAGGSGGDGDSDGARGGAGGAGGAGGDSGGVAASSDGTVQYTYVATASISGGAGGSGGTGGDGVDGSSPGFPDGDDGDDGADGTTGESGGLLASNNGEVTESYWDKEATGLTTSDAGLALTTREMTGDRAEDNMSFDFTDTWDTSADDPSADGFGVFYPVLQTNTQDPAPKTTLYAAGDGNDDPYQIETWGHLDNVRENLDAEFELVADLDESTHGYDVVAGESANNGNGFDPIGDDDNPFGGTFNGSEYTISNLVIDQSNSGETPVGLFGHVGGDGEINNITLVSASVTGDESQTGVIGDRTGGLVGLLEGTVTNSSADATVVGGRFVGGLVGRNDGGTVSESYATGDVDGNRNIGGLVGRNDGGTVSESYATGNVDGTSRIGGLVGINDGGTVSKSYATGTVGGINNVGGLVGFNNEATVSESYATGDVDGNDGVGGLVASNDGGTVNKSYATGDVGGRDGVGGLVGGNSGTVSESYATGTVDGNRFVGGLVGRNEGGTVSESYATGTAHGDRFVGGLVGLNNEATVSESYASGSVDDADNVGGLVGFNNEATVTDSYWDTEATGQDDSAGGIGLTTIEMKGADSSLDGFDFENTWDVVSDQNVSYPFLQAIAQEPAPGLESVENVSVSLADDEIEQGEETSFTVNVSLSESGESEATRVSNLTSSNPANATVDQNGTVTGTGVGTVTVTGAYGSEEDSATLTVTPGPSVEVDVETQPATSTAGEPLAGPPAVLVIDEFGNPTPGTNVSVTVVDDDDALVSGNRSVETNESGISAFDDLVIETATDYQLEFSIDDAEDGVNESDTAISKEFIVEPAEANSVEILTEPVDSTAGESISGPPTVNVTDEFDNLVDGINVTVSEMGGYTFDNGTTSIETVDGIATFDDLIIETAADYQLDFSITDAEDGVVESDDAASDVFTVEPADANSIDVVTEPATSTAGESISGPPTVKVTDEFDNLVDGINVTVSEMGGYTFDSGTTTIETVDGIATFDDLVIETAADYQLEFSITEAEDGVVESDDAASDVFTVEPADANSVDIVTEPADSTAGEPIIGPPTVLVVDEFGNPTPGTNVSVTVVDDDDALVSGDLEVETNESGISTFDDLVIETAADYELEFSITDAEDGVNESDTTISKEFTVEPAEANSVEILTEPADSTAGESISGPPTVNVTDEFDNLVDGINVTVSEMGGYTFDNGTTTIETVDGIAIFDDLVIETAADYQLEFSITEAEDGVVVSDDAASDVFTVEPADANLVDIDTEPATSTAGETLAGPPAVLVLDEFGNPTPGTNVSVTVVDDDDALVSGDLEVETNESGISTFDNLVIETTADYQLEFAINASEDGVNESDNAISEVFTVDPADPDSFEIKTQPNATQTAGEIITGLPAVNLTDAFYNPIPELTISATTDGPGPVVSGGDTDTDGDGVATFDDLVIETAGDYELNFSIDGESLDNLISDEFTVEPADANSVEIVTEPADSTAGESIAGPPTVNVTDEFDNLVDGINVTVSEADGYTFDNGTTTIETVDGIATFDDLVIETAANYELEFSITDAEDGVVESDDASSDVFTVEPTDANSVDIDTQPADSTAGELIVGPPTVNVTDTFNNQIANETVTATINGSATLDGATEAVTNSTGIAVFDQLSNTTADTYELAFTLAENNAVNSISDAFEITPAAPDSLAATNVTETAGVEGEITLTLTDEFSNRIPGERINVSHGSNVSNLAETAVTNESGAAAFGFNETTSGTYTPTFDVAEDDTVTESTTVTIEPAAAINFEIKQNGLVHTVSNDFDDDNALNVSVTLSDQFDNLVPNATVSVTDDGTGTMVHPGREQKTDENATASFTIQTATPQENLNFTFTERESGQNNSAVLEGVEFEPALPEARGSASSYTVTLGTDVTFRASDSTAPDGSNPQYNWTFEDDGTEIETATGLTHTTNFTQPATITTTLNVTVANETSTDTFTVTVEDRKRPTARLTAPETVAVGESFELTGTESTDNIAIADYKWDFGNGTVINGSTLIETTGTYADPGEYDVVLTVTDTSGNTDTNTTTIVAEGANATLSTEPLEFGEVGNNSAATESISISNDGTIALNVTESTISGDNASAFRVTGDDEPRIRPGESRSLRVAFEPTTVGEKNATLEITTENNTGANSFEIDLSGESIESNLTAESPTVDFGSVDVGTAVDQNVTLANDGTDNATIETIELLGSDASQFSVDSDLSTIAAGDTANVSVGFDPQAVGSQSATLRVETTDGDSTRVSLSATVEGPQLNVPSTSRSAGSIGSGTDTTVRAELRNYGSQPLNVTNLTLTGDGSEAFEIDTDTTNLLIGPDNSETVELTFAPDEPDDYTTTLNVAHNDTTTDTAELVFSGTAVAADIDIDQSTLDFGTTQVGQPEFLNLTISNEDNAGAALNITSTSIVGSNAEDFSIENPERPFTIAAGDERDLRVNFTALAAGAREAQLQINSDSNQGQTNVWLSNTRSYIVVQEVSNPTVSVDGRNLDEGSSRLLNVSTPSTRGSDVTIDELGFEMQRDGDFDLELSNSDSDFGNAFDADGDTEIIQYVGIDHIDHLSNETFEDTSLIYRVDTDALPADVEPADVQINRYDETNGEYVELDAQFVGERSGQLHYEVETPGFSEFAITVDTSDDPTPSPTPSPSPGSGPSSGSGPSPPTLDPAGPTITGEPSESGDLSVTISGQQAGDRITVDGASADTGGLLSGVETIQVDSLDIGLNTDREVRFDVSTYEGDLTPSYGHETSPELSERLRSASASFEAETGTLSAGYVYIDHDLADEEVDNIAFAFSIRQAYLDEIGVDPEAVTLYRQESDGWNALPTEQIGSTDSHVRFESSSPGLSVFALGTGAPPVGVTEATLRDEQIETGETATVDVTVENRGQHRAEHTLELTADGEIVATEFVSMDGGETAEATLSFEPLEGEYTMAVDGTEAGTLTVGEGEPNPSWLWLLISLGVLIAAVLWRRSQNAENEKQAQ